LGARGLPLSTEGDATTTGALETVGTDTDGGDDIEDEEDEVPPSVAALPGSPRGPTLCVERLCSASITCMRAGEGIGWLTTQVY